MSNDFIVSALGKNEFSKYFDMPAQELADMGAYLFESDQCPCYPCRVSLIDARVGETVLALSYEHHGENSPYRSSGPIFVRQTANTAKLGKNEIPEMLRHRLLSVRGYDADKLMIEADTTMGSELEALLIQLFDNNRVQYIHVHNAGPGCFNCLVERA